MIVTIALFHAECGEKSRNGNYTLGNRVLFVESPVRSTAQFLLSIFVRFLDFSCEIFDFAAHCLHRWIVFLISSEVKRYAPPWKMLTFISSSKILQISMTVLYSQNKHPGSKWQMAQWKKNLVPCRYLDLQAHVRKFFIQKLQWRRWKTINCWKPQILQKFNARKSYCFHHSSYIIFSTKPRPREVVTSCNFCPRWQSQWPGSREYICSGYANVLVMLHIAPKTEPKRTPKEPRTHPKRTPNASKTHRNRSVSVSSISISSSI